MPRKCYYCKHGVRWGSNEYDCRYTDCRWHKDCPDYFKSCGHVLQDSDS